MTFLNDRAGAFCCNRRKHGGAGRMDIHAHEVMHMMLERDEDFSRESLARAITERFGKDATFRSCSASGMDVETVIAFLESRGKFVAREAGFTTARDKICNH
jgi:probable metal-binding protein